MLLFTVDHTQHDSAEDSSDPVRQAIHFPESMVEFLYLKKGTFCVTF